MPILTVSTVKPVEFNKEKLEELKKHLGFPYFFKGFFLFSTNKKNEVLVLNINKTTNRQPHYCHKEEVSIDCDFSEKDLALVSGAINKGLFSLKAFIPYSPNGESPIFAIGKNIAEEIYQEEAIKSYLLAKFK